MVVCFSVCLPVCLRLDMPMCVPRCLVNYSPYLFVLHKLFADYSFLCICIACQRVNGLCSITSIRIVCFYKTHLNVCLRVFYIWQNVIYLTLVIEQNEFITKLI